MASIRMNSKKPMKTILVRKMIGSVRAGWAAAFTRAVMHYYAFQKIGDLVTLAEAPNWLQHKNTSITN